MDLEIIEKMNPTELKKYIEFLLWHYRVMDSFWYICTTERFDEPTADRINEEVWGRVTAMAAKDLLKRYDIRTRGLDGFLRALKFWPWSILVGYEVERKDHEVVLSVPSCPTQKARLKHGLQEYDCKEMHRREFQSFAREIDDRIQVECLFAPPDPHPEHMHCQWRFHLESS